MDEEGLNELIRTVEWDSHITICKEMLGLIGERVPNHYEEVRCSDDDVVIYTPNDEHVGTKRKDRYKRGTSKTVGMKRGAKKKMEVVHHMTLIFDITKCEKLQDCEPNETILQKEVVFKATERNCVVDTMEYFYQFKNVKEAIIDVWIL